ncbi:MAG: hypothetical protein AAB462_01100 [Patescibacteria group bacterium]
MSHKSINAHFTYLKTKPWFRLFVLWATAYSILLGFFFRQILKDSGYIEIFPNELILPMLMHATTALIFALAISKTRWLKSYTSKVMAVIVLAFSIVGYDGNLQAFAGTIRAITPWLSESDPLGAVSLVYVVVLYALAVAIGVGLERGLNHYKKINKKDVQIGLFVLTGYLLIVPAFSMARILPTIISETSVQAPPIAQVTPSTDKEKPDIYYIVLDRYTNSDVLNKQFKYDNSPFTDFLKDNNFYVNNNANSNYPYTTMSVSSTLNAQYTNKLVTPYKENAVQSRALYHNLIWQSSVVKAIKSQGYKYYSLGSWYGATYKAPLADRQYINQHVLTVMGKSKTLRGIEASQFAQSPYYRFAQMADVSWWPFKIVEQDPIGDLRQQLDVLNYLSTKEKPGGRFIFAHILVPHEPFYYNADGSLSITTNADSVGKPIKEKYVAQVKFINTHMQELVSNIQKQSKGQAVVIFNADEGAYPQVLNDTFTKPTGTSSHAEASVNEDENMTIWSKPWTDMKFGILQAVHIPRATEDDLKNLSSVNLFRIVLNRYANYNLDYLPECQFGLVEGNQKEYNYTSITDRFSTKPDRACQNLSTVPKR